MVPAWIVRDDGVWFMYEFHEEEADPMVFCDGRFMRRSEMRRLVAEDMAHFARLDAIQQQKWEAQRQAVEAQNRAFKKAVWRAEWQRQWEEWQRNNEEAVAEAYAEERAWRRQLKDEAMVRELMARIESKHRPDLMVKQTIQERWLDQLSDHDYIEWMFACAERGFKV